tara:strand:- start:26883 stop:27269 length:387 start_codon:yes stop_codon:yes gene_type:complete
METENNNTKNNKPIEKPKEVEAALEPKSIEGQDEKTPAKKIKRQATQEQLDHPLHGVKLVEILESVVEYYGWKYLADEVNILCFKHSPTIKVSLKFLRKFKWAREHVEDLYLDMLEEEAYQKKRKEKS